MKDPDIFGDVKETKGDADIFVDLPTETDPKKSAMPTPVEKPGFSYKQEMQRGGMELAKGFLKAGPMGMAAAGAGEAMRHIDSAVDKAATATGGVVTDLTAGVLPPEAAAGAGYASNVAVRALPMLFSGQAASKLAQGTFQNMGRGLMQSALKPDYASLKTGKAAKAIETMLQEGVPVSEGGLVKLRGAIDDLGDEVGTLVGQSSATVNPTGAGKELVGVYEKLLKGTNREANLETLRKHWAEFKSNPLFSGRTDVPVQTVQAVKQAYTKDLGDKAYGMGLKPEAERDTLKAIERGMKNLVQDAVPGVGQINAKQSELINAAKLLERRVLMDPNKALLGLSPFAWNPIGFAAFMLDRAPGFKSLLARGAYSGSHQVPANVTRAGVGYLMLPPEEERGALYDVPKYLK